jgi:glycosyltransferase involved in cell wall biosynthesis
MITTLVIPHYNDAERLGPFLADLCSGLPGHFEVLVSDDGSLESEREAMRRVVREAQARVVEGGPVIRDAVFTEKNTGKGGAVLRGWDVAAGAEVLAFADADGAVGVDEIVRAEASFRSGDYDALFANRVKMLGRSVERSLKRHLSGRVFATLVSNVARIPAYDTQCGLKMLRRAAFEKIRPHQETVGFAFDVELCLLLLKFGFRVIEFPVDWRDVPGSKVSLVRDSWRMAREVFRIRRRVEGIAGEVDHF